MGSMGEESVSAKTNAGGMTERDACEARVRERILTLVTRKLVALKFSRYSLERLEVLTDEDFSNEIEGLAIKLTTRLLCEPLKVSRCSCGRDYEVMAVYPHAPPLCEVLGSPIIVAMSTG